ncbi:bifunctional 4-hydroxy-3-methylbut-2-enyl diphosphate reductase/30S ribosomal protein S1 [Eubacterium coprostanoligenes]|uniref:bifunctional 4-hydroxy-3-methylbut-2-enyl diphosphate reductase/30S ribosomal protein S1 n=1 Tax=Eubacterium coprostanoligenes TaxID=290054 RepID=UPI002357C9F2|nr:bifunctional 4-hydroxy-3-methylbut-2-enyl diphosphate reductase/30S ribosomal protein S1 [Eubacterium coprostanoligenes]MCI6254917.1 bifunctional 4-hydroxy-3-methylbut-2-enyl diphosphate reductase/30S ribosomal protein S1 [Eubacterium coprostanoligenes]MDY5400212.1 bifunctional 4-hydroxy-3-methylbut-2-enyl diphosphate reductase/30S ribosomal protein S1 [Eubacterium coprostanoligenes]
MSKQIILAKTAGFCFGVDRAVNLVYELVGEGKKVCTLGPIIHNAQLVADLESKGVKIIDDISQAPQGYTVVVRTHGVEKSVLDELESKDIDYVNATCPFVTKIHNIVKKQDENTVVLIAGDKNHPEVLGIKSYCKGDSYVFKNEEELTEIIQKHKIAQKNDVICVAQTTFSLNEQKKCKKIFKKLCTNCKIFDTICNATSDRQNEAEELSKNSDAMIVVGGRHSSNTCKLRDTGEANCPTFLIETADELASLDLSKYNVIGVTAGASTPSVIIKEVLKSMSEEIKEKEVETTSAVTEEVVETAENADKATKPAVKASADGEASFEELLNESFKENENSKVVTGTVVRITPTEVFVDVPGRKQTGVVAFDDLSSENISKCEDVVAVGDEIQLVIMKTDDQDGVLKLSKRLFDAVKGWDEIVAAKENDEILEGQVTAVIRGGVLVSAKGTRVFVPASLTGVPRNQELSVLKDATVKFKIIDINPARRRAVGSIKVVSDAERKEKQEALWATLKEGDKVKGTVKSLTSYGAFVDLGGIDGMVHISELSWSRIKHPSEVVNVGDVVEVTIKSLDEETKKISLGFKNIEDNPWEILKRDYPVGSVVDAKIVSFATFGAFANILPTVDGLIHISQISWDRIKAPQDVLKIGDVVKAKIIEIDFDKKRVSLSMKELLDKPETAEDDSAEAEETAEEATEE